MNTTFEAATRFAVDHGHFVKEHDWHPDSPTPGRAWATCPDCGGTIEMREDGKIVFPGTTDTCAALLRAEAEQREGISDYYDQAWNYAPDPADFS